VAIAVPNFSEGRDLHAIGEVERAFARADVLDRHSDAVHNRTVLTVCGDEPNLREALIDGAEACIARIDMSEHDGEHPCIGALDVCPVVWLAPETQETAREIALDVTLALGELGVPVFFYGELAAAPERRERSYFRHGGLRGLTERMRVGELRPDFGPTEPHPTAGATLVTARTPLAAFNVELDTGEVEVAAAVAAELREAGNGMTGVRAIGIDLGERAQVSTNIHDPYRVSLGAVIERVRALAAEHGARPVAGEVVGLVPEATVADLPEDVPLRGFDPDRHVLERRLASGGDQ
jgi:glutamate formiminotransferase